jgi:hypothetical protein
MIVWVFIEPLAALTFTRLGTLNIRADYVVDQLRDCHGQRVEQRSFVDGECLGHEGCSIHIERSVNTIIRETINANPNRVFQFINID